MAENFLTKEYAGMPGWVWGAGIVLGLYITGGFSALFGKKQQATTAADGTVLPPIQGSIGDLGATTILPGSITPAAASAATTTAAAATAPAAPPVTCYTVQPGDSLSAIASQFSTPGGYPQLVIWNSVANSCSPGYPQLLVNPNLIYAGWKLRVK